MEWNHKRIRLTAMWLSSLVGAVFGLFFTIIGAGFNWGPGSGMEGPYWKILIVGLISLLIGMYVGELIARKLSAIVFKKPRKRHEMSLFMFLVTATASLIAWILSWEAGYIAGTLMDTIKWLDPAMGQIILDVALMSSILGAPLAIAAGTICALISWFTIKK